MPGLNPQWFFLVAIGYLGLGNLGRARLMPSNRKSGNSWYFRGSALQEKLEDVSLVAKSYQKLCQSVISVF
jgi:hypothetical protein